MQRRLYGVLFLTNAVLMIGTLTGCGTADNGSVGETVETVTDTAEKDQSLENDDKKKQEKQQEQKTQEKEQTTEKKISADSQENTQTSGADLKEKENGEAEQAREVETQVLSEMQMVSLEVENASNFAMELPGFMDRNEASLEADPELEQLLIHHYGLTEEISKQTRYYYDRIDLNGDEVDEIFAILVGPETTGIAGSMGSLILKKDGKLEIEKDFSQLYMPIVVSTNMQDGWHDLILCVGAEDGMEHYVVLTHDDGAYAIGGQVLDSLDGIDGAAYLCNDLNEDQETGRYLTLGK
mgnify:CR=1 FL=1